MRMKTLVLALIFSISVSVVYSQSVLNYSSNNAVDEARKKKKLGGKYTLPLLFGALLIKSIIFPLAFKAMAVMSSIAVILSTMSLILSSIVGYAKLAATSSVPSVKVVHKHPYSSWSKDDDNALKNFYAPMDGHDLVAPPPQRMM